MQDILSGQITLDTSLVSSLFSPEDYTNLGGLPSNMAGLMSNNGGGLPANISLPADDLIQDESDLNGVSATVFLNDLYVGT